MQQQSEVKNQAASAAGVAATLSCQTISHISTFHQIPLSISCSQAHSYTHTYEYVRLSDNFDLFNQQLLRLACFLTSSDVLSYKPQLYVRLFLTDSIALANSASFFLFVSHSVNI